MSNHFTHSLAILGTAGVLLLAGWLGLRHVLENNAPAGLALQRNDKEAVSYDSTSHILTVITAKGTQKSYTRTPVIRIEKDGSVKIQKKTFGFEHAPFLGLGYSLSALSTHRNAYLGLNLVDAWRFDGGIAAALSPGYFRPLLEAQYNFYSNTSLMLGYWFDSTYHAAIAVKF